MRKQICGNFTQVIECRLYVWLKVDLKEKQRTHKLISILRTQIVAIKRGYMNNKKELYNYRDIEKLLFALKCLEKRNINVQKI